MVFENDIQRTKEKVEVENFSKSKISGNTAYSPPNKKSNKSYLFSFICVLLLGILGVSAYMKPTKVKMENDIINKFLETQPQFVKIFKNVFLGEEITEEKADNLIYNVLRSSGYKIYFKISDLGITNRLEIVDEISDKTLLVAYGFFGETFITYKADDLVIDFNKNKVDSNSHKNSNTSRESEKYEKIEKLDYDPDFWNKTDKPNFNEKPIKEESKLKSRGESSENKLKTEPQGDSIKI